MAAEAAEAQGAGRMEMQTVAAVHIRHRGTLTSREANAALSGEPDGGHGLQSASCAAHRGEVVA